MLVYIKLKIQEINIDKDSSPFFEELEYSDFNMTVL